MPSHPYEKSEALFKRATTAIPGGIYGHISPIVNVPGSMPYYAERAEGCRYWDVDGNEYIDFMCGYGPIILGYQHEEVEAAAARQREKGDLFNHPTTLMVELAEYLKEKIDFADWAVFAKNGSDVTTWAIQVAREATDCKKIVMVKGAYHGSAPWCTPGYGGLIEEDRIHVHLFEWNSIESLHRVIDRYRDQIAACIITPYHHPAFGESVLPEPGFLSGIQQACNEQGISLILDDIRAGFRLHPGGSHRSFDFEPDMACFSKAIANGYPLSAAVGRESLRNAASKVYLTGSYWHSAVSMAAALACLSILERDQAPERLRSLGKQLMSGLEERGAKYGYQVRRSGPPAIPFMVFDDDPDFFLQQRWCALSARHGVFFHPHHNWFLSTAHTERDIEQALQAAEKAFSELHQASE